MLHRFTDPATGTVGHEPADLRQTLGFLRRRGYELVELGEMFRRLSDYDIRFLTRERRAELVAAVAEGDAYIVGGWTATLGGEGGMATTPFGPDDPA